MTMLAVLFALFASRLFGMKLGRSLGEGRRLPLGRAFELFQTFAQGSVLFAKALNFEKQFLNGGSVHARSRQRQTVSAVRNYREF